MSCFDTVPDGPIHGECEAEIHRLEEINTDMLKALRLIAAIGEGSTTVNSLQHIAKLARAAIHQVEQGVAA